MFVICLSRNQRNNKCIIIEIELKLIYFDLNKYTTTTLYQVIYRQQHMIFTCSESTMKTPEHYVEFVNNKDIRKT